MVWLESEQIKTFSFSFSSKVWDLLNFTLHKKCVWFKPLGIIRNLQQFLEAYSDPNFSVGSLKTVYRCQKSHKVSKGEGSLCLRRCAVTETGRNHHFFKYLHVLELEKSIRSSESHYNVSSLNRQEIDKRGVMCSLIQYPTSLSL